MKKKFKKLTLKTETLRSLSNSSLKDAVGADTINIDPASAMTKCATRNCTFCTAACSECTAPCTNCTAGCSICCP